MHKHNGIKSYRTNKPTIKNKGQRLAEKPGKLFFLFLPGVQKPTSLVLGWGFVRMAFHIVADTVQATTTSPSHHHLTPEGRSERTDPWGLSGFQAVGGLKESHQHSAWHLETDQQSMSLFPCIQCSCILGFCLPFLIASPPILPLLTPASNFSGKFNPLVTISYGTKLAYTLLKWNLFSLNHHFFQLALKCVLPLHCGNSECKLLLTEIWVLFTSFLLVMCKLVALFSMCHNFTKAGSTWVANPWIFQPQKEKRGRCFGDSKTGSAKELFPILICWLHRNDSGS